MCRFRFYSLMIKGEIQLKKKTFVNIIAILITLIIVVVCSVMIKSNAKVDCTTCEGEGNVYELSCNVCEGEGVVADSETGEETECTICEGKGGLNSVDCADCEDGKVDADSEYYSTFVALLPPLVAISLALITKEVYSSLFVGILLGGLFATNWKPVSAVDAIVNDGFISAISGTAGIFMFLVILGTIVALMNKAGGSAAFGRWAETHIKTRIGAQLATFVLGVLIFIDDYFNCLTVGSVMLPVTDRHKISRAKLAYLIDATAAPICMIAPVSSWAAAVSKFAEGTGYSGIELFIKAIPYNFYSLLTFVFIIALVFMKFDYGPMKLHEYNAINNNDLYTSGERVDKDNELEGNPKGRVIDLILPVLALVIICVAALIYVGGFFDGADFITAFGDTDATIGLPWGALIALVLTVIYLIARRIITFKDAMDCIPRGFMAMVPAILILTMATSLKNITGLLGADVFVSGLMESAASGLANFLPAIIFLVACALAFATGTSWGTFGILIPIVAAMFTGPEQQQLLIIGMSACLAGAVCGDHCSPISDTTIMSSAGAKSNHLNHVSTQLPYAITVAAISFLMYFIAAFIQDARLLLPIGAVLTVAVLFVIKTVTKEKVK